MAIFPDDRRAGNDFIHVSGLPAHGRAWAGMLLLLCWLASWPTAVAGAGPGVTAALRARVAGLRHDGQPEGQGNRLAGAGLLAAFYEQRAFEPAWADPSRAAALLGLLRRAGEHGLEPADFLAARFAELAGPQATAERQAERDLLLTEALARYGHQRRFGKVDPVTLYPAWNFGRNPAAPEDVLALLAGAAAAPSLEAYLDEKLPASRWYRLLQAALARYRGMAAAGGWPLLPAGPVLRPGETDPRIPLFRERLRIEGDLAPGGATAEPELFDPALADAVRRFQGRHALAQDAVVGAQTRAALNVPASARVDQLRLSLERLRWLGGQVPDTYVVVNVASFQAGFVRNHELAWSSRVVVGRSARQTPIFMGRMTYLELNPSWTIPPTILRQDILPRLRRDPAYLVRERISVLDQAGRRVDPAGIDWAAMGRGIPYALRQEPGPDNALGRIKFMFPNPHMVYLHDTPAKALFERAERSFSSGCIRVEDPLALASLVLDDPAWDRPALEAAIATGETRRIPLDRPLPVLMVYLTSLAEPSGEVRFFRDIYGRDATLLAALDAPLRPLLSQAPAGGTAIP